MKFLPHNLTIASSAIEAEVLKKHRQWLSDRSVSQGLSREFHHLAQTDLAQASSAQQEAWLQRLYANLRLQQVTQHGEAVVLASPRSCAEAAVDVVDLLAEPTPEERLRALGRSTYEDVLHRLCAMATLGVTLASSLDEYVTRFCQEYAKFRQEGEAEHNWLSLLASLQNALQHSLSDHVVASASAVTGKHEVISLPSASLSRPLVRLTRQRVVSFSAITGLLLVCALVMWGLPALSRFQKAEPAVPPAPTRTVTAAVSASPAPAAVEAVVERAGWYVIGVAAREEAVARAEAEQRRGAGLQPRVVYSSHWSGLTPNYYLVVYGICDSRAETVVGRKDLEKRGIKTYIMYSGQRKP